MFVSRSEPILGTALLRTMRAKAIDRRQRVFRSIFHERLDYLAAPAHSTRRLRKSSKFCRSCSRANPKAYRRPRYSAGKARVAPSRLSPSIVAMNFASACSTAPSTGGCLRSRSASAHARKKPCAAHETCSSGSRRRGPIGSGKGSAAARPIMTTSLRKRKTVRTNGSGSNSLVR